MCLHNNTVIQFCKLLPFVQHKRAGDFIAQNFLGNQLKAVLMHYNSIQYVKYLFLSQVHYQRWR